MYIDSIYTQTHLHTNENQLKILVKYLLTMICKIMWIKRRQERKIKNLPGRKNDDDVDEINYEKMMDANEPRYTQYDLFSSVWAQRMFLNDIIELIAGTETDE